MTARIDIDEKYMRWDDALAIVHEQAEDEGLWFAAQTAAEGYLQQELRRLHAAVETPAIMRRAPPLSDAEWPDVVREVSARLRGTKQQ